MGYPRCVWTKAELIALLTKKAKDLEASIKRGGRDMGDALFLVLSGHGIKGSLITWDHKLISKTEIHRMFSSQGNVRSRSVPRIFLFDCCDGCEDMKNVLPTPIPLPSVPEENELNEESEVNEAEEKAEEKEEQKEEE